MNIQKFNGSEFKPGDKNSPNEMLIQAAIAHNYDSIDKLIGQGADVNYIHTGKDRQNDYTPLYCAVHSDIQTDEENYLKVIELLLLRGADPNYQVRRGFHRYKRKQPAYLLWFAKIFQKFQNKFTKIKLIELFYKYGANLNGIFKHKVGFDYSGYTLQMSLVFGIFDDWKTNHQFSFLKNISYQQKFVPMKEQYELFIKNKFLKLNQIKEIQQKSTQEDSRIKMAKIKEKHFDTIKNQKIRVEIQEVIQGLIKLGVDPNSYRQFTYSSFRSYRMNITNYQYETLLHRAIFRNQPKLVKFLLDNGADPNINCKYAGLGFCFPHQWPQYQKNSKIQENLNLLQRYEKEKIELEQQLIKNSNQEQKQKLKQKLQQNRFNIFKCKIFTIENAEPESIGTIQEISCLQLAQLYQVDQEIIQLLKSYHQKQ